MRNGSLSQNGTKTKRFSTHSKHSCESRKKDMYYIAGFFMVKSFQNTFFNGSLEAP